MTGGPIAESRGHCQGIPPVPFSILISPRFPPHTPARNQFERRLARWGYPQLDPPLLRSVRIPRWNATVTFIPTTFRPSPKSPRRSEGLDLTLQTPGSGLTGTGPQPTSVGTLQAHGLTLTDASPVSGLVEGVIVVPDGVAKVTLKPVRFISQTAGIDPRQIVPATVAVHDNIAAYQFRIPTGANRQMATGVRGVPSVALATWVDANGNVIKQTTTRLDLFIKVDGKASTPTSRRNRSAIRNTPFCRQNPSVC
jgi:hypothetical protein